VDDTLGVYISVPLCRAKCSYCNFASGVYSAGDHARYVNQVCATLDRERVRLLAAGTAEVEIPSAVGSVYFGGGTPSLLAPDLFERIFARISQEYSFTPDPEITVECAPGQIPDAFLEAMLRCGVGRVSLGVQSFVDSEARAVGRSHGCESVLKEIARLREAGIARINVDLVAGLPGQTCASWRRSLEQLLASGVDHASVYMLEVDEDSRLGRELIGGGARYGAALVPADDSIAAMYEEACSTLQAAGLRQYEISNFAAEGCESAHNLRYWRRLPYLGAGLDAHSMLRTRDGGAVRWAETDALERYLGAHPKPQPRRLTRAEEMEEAWFLGLRLNEGVSWPAMEAEFGTEVRAVYEGVVERLMDDDLLETREDRVRLTGRGRMIANDVFGEFLLEESLATH
jgi:oxygen-independent coproporphyrinogen-3 oxidase